MGTGTVLLYFYRKAVFKEFLRQAPLAWSPLHDSPHPPELADFRHNRPQAAWHLFWAFIPFFLGSKPINVFELDYITYLKSFGVLLVICILFSTPLPRRIFTVFRRNPLIEALILIAIFAGSVYCLFMGLDDPFLYFRF